MSIDPGDMGALIDEVVSYNCGREANMVLAHVMDRQWIAGELAPVAVLMASALKSNHTIWVFGNGGSAAQAQHFVTELTIGFRIRRGTGLSAVCLSADPSSLTAAANDLAPKRLFAGALCACAHPGDIAFGITTSASENVLYALSEARQERGVLPVLLAGRASAVAPWSEPLISVVPPDAPGHFETAHTQVGHLVVLHMLAYLIEELTR